MKTLLLLTRSLLLLLEVQALFRSEQGLIIGNDSAFRVGFRVWTGIKSDDIFSSFFRYGDDTWGRGWSTTFNIPDKRGRSSFGKDDMGGLRLTGSRIKPVDGTEIPLALPGSETHQLTQAQLPAYSITFNKQFGSATTGATKHYYQGIL